MKNEAFSEHLDDEIVFAHPSVESQAARERIIRELKDAIALAEQLTGDGHFLRYRPDDEIDPLIQDLARLWMVASDWRQKLRRYRDRAVQNQTEREKCGPTGRSERGERKRRSRAGNNLTKLKAEMAAAHPDRGGTNEAFIKAFRRYEVARAAQHERRKGAR